MFVEMVDACRVGRCLYSLVKFVQLRKVLLLCDVFSKEYKKYHFIVHSYIFSLVILFLYKKNAYMKNDLVHGMYGTKTPTYSHSKYFNS